jgi:pimeloyl-ACP methyl ester carboxylesterase
MTQHQMHEIRSGLHLHCIAWGEPSLPEAPMLLVHGLASNARLWDGVAEHLVDLGHYVVAIDQRGHGQSSKPDDGFDMSTVAHDLELFITQLGLHRPVVAGQSWGANVVIELAARAPHLVRGVCAVDGGTIQLQKHFPEWETCEQQLRPPNLLGTPATRLEGAIRAHHSDWPEAGIRGAMANMEVLADGTIRPWLSLERHLKVLRGLWEHNPEERFPNISVPVLFMPAVGSGEAAWAVDKKEAVARALELLPKGAANWYEPADHDLHAQFPQRVAQELHDASVNGFFI